MKGMTNALPVLIDASTLATKSDISDMETKTSANATFATKATVTQIQTAVGDCFNEVALGSDGKSLDFTAVDGQVNNIGLPSNGGEWKVSSKTLDDLVIRDADTYGFKITEEFIIEIIVLEAYSKESSGLFNIEHIHVYPIEIRKPATNPTDFPTDGAYEYVDTVYFISRKHPYIQAYKSWGLGKGNYVKIIAYTNQTTFTDAVYTNKTDLSEFYPYEYGESSMGYRSEYDNVIYRILTKS